MASVTIEAKTRNCFRRIGDIRVDVIRAKREAETIMESGEFTDAMQKAVESLEGVAVFLELAENAIKAELHKAGFGV